MGPSPHMVGGHRRWDCQCECGKRTTLRSSQISGASIQSCGCLVKEVKRAEKTKHGLYYHPSYGTWQKMMQRCHNEHCSDFPEYGARGISVTQKWHDVANFIADMGERPDGASIDRIDNSKGYMPGNCRWASPQMQANNTRRNKFYEHGGKHLSITQWERELGINKGTLWARLNRGVPFEEAIKS